MSESIGNCKVWRRTTFFLLGLATALGAGAPVTLLSASGAKAQTAGMERRQERREARHERREDRREGRQERRDDRRGGTAEQTGSTAQAKPESTHEAKASSPGTMGTPPVTK
jgi:hypothetical protein